MDDANTSIPGQPDPVSPCPVAGRWLCAGVFLAVLFAYFVGESRTPPYNDSKFIYTVAESIVYRNSIDIPVPGGVLKAQHPLLPSAIHVPGVLLRKAIAKGDPALDRLVKPMTSHLGTQVMVALGCLVFFRLLLHLGISLGASSLGTVALAFATFLPVYSRTSWSEALQAACFIGFFSAFIRLKDNACRKTGLWFGGWTGMLVNSKYAFVLVLPGAMLFLAYHAWRGKKLRRLVAALAWPVIPGAFFLVVILWYNWARTGSLTNSGYPTLAGLSETVFRESLFVGLWSYFFSFGKSIFLYNPPLVLSVLALPLVSRRHAAFLWALLLTAGPLVCLYSKFVFWSGDWCWGPRYLLFVVPPMLIPAVFLLDEALRERKRIVLAACAAVFLLGVSVQVVGASQYWDHFIRFSKNAQIRWLGNPNRSGALTLRSRRLLRSVFRGFLRAQLHAGAAAHRGAMVVFEAPSSLRPLGGRGQGLAPAPLHQPGFSGRARLVQESALGLVEARFRRTLQARGRRDHGLLSAWPARRNDAVGMRAACRQADHSTLRRNWPV